MTQFVYFYPVGPHAYLFAMMLFPVKKKDCHLVKLKQRCYDKNMNDKDLAKIDKLLQKRLKENLQNFPTKSDLKASLEESAKKVTEDISDVVTQLFNEAEKLKADKTQTLSLEIRVDKLERKAFPQQ